MSGPPDGVWRRSAKGVLLDPRGRVLLLLVRDPTAPATTWWELPGGGLEEGEGSEQALVREVAEETGLVVPLAAVGPPLWRRRATFVWLGRRRWQEEVVHVVRLPADVDRVPTALDRDEAGAFLEQRWWPAGDVVAGPVPFYRGRLAELLPRVLGGEEVDEGFEAWN